MNKKKKKEKEKGEYANDKIQKTLKWINEKHHYINPYQDTIIRIPLNKQ